MSSMPTSLPLEILPQQRVEHAVDPVAVPPVGPPPDALADEADPLRVAHRPLVEAVDLELQPVVVEVEEEVPAEDARRLVGEPPPAELRMHREPEQVRDPAPAVRHLERHAPGALPARARSVVDLDHEAPVLLRLTRRLLDGRRDRLPIARPAA